jgi:hypothetical protein
VYRYLKHLKLGAIHNDINLYSVNGITGTGLKKPQFFNRESENALARQRLLFEAKGNSPILFTKPYDTILLMNIIAKICAKIPVENILGVKNRVVPVPFLFVNVQGVHSCEICTSTLCVPFPRQVAY